MVHYSADRDGYYVMYGMQLVFFLQNKYKKIKKLVI